MPDEFDPYRQWLGRTATERPLNYYQLLDLPEFEDRLGRIENAEMIEMAKVLRHENGPHAAIARQLCDELQQAVSTLSDPVKKAAYDAQLRASRTPPSAVNYYRLLNLDDFEENRARIENAEMIEMAKALRSGNSQACEELERAVRTLLDPVQKAAYDASLRGIGSPSHEESPPEHDFSADLRLGDEEEEESFAQQPAPDIEPPHNEPAVPSEPSRSTSLWQDASNTDELAASTPATAPSAPKEAPRDVVSAAIDEQLRRATASIGQPEEKAPRVSVSMPQFSMPKVPIKPLIGGVAALILVWAAYALFTRGEPTGQLYGKVTFQGAPAGHAELRFESTANPDYLFIGGSGLDGIYHLSYRMFDGLPVGHYRVTITHYTPKGGKTVATAEEESPDEEATTQKSVVFEQDIAKGSNTIDFELTQGQELKPQG